MSARVPGAPSRRLLWGLGVALAALAAFRYALIVPNPSLANQYIRDSFEFLIVLVGTVTCVRAAGRSIAPAHALWATTAGYLAAQTLGSGHDVLIHAGITSTIVLSVLEVIGRCSYLPLAFLAFFPVTGNQGGGRRSLPLLDFAQITIAIALLYLRFDYLPHAQPSVPWALPERPVLLRNVLISAGLLLRAGLDPSDQARAVYRRVGGAFAVIPVAAIVLGRPGSIVLGLSALMLLGLLAYFWKGGPDTVTVSQRGLFGTRLALSMVAAANLIVVVLLTSGAPERYRPMAYLIIAVSIALFIARGILAESARYVTEKALRTSEERYATTFRASPDGIAIRHLGSDGLIEVNERFATMLGYSRSELVGQSLPELGVVDSEYGDLFLSRVERIGTVHDFEFNVRRKDGGRLQMLASAERVEIGGRTCAVMIFRDISVQKKADAEIRAAAEEMRELYVRLAHAEDDERRALHAELHDQVGANLSALRLELDVAARLLANNDVSSAQRHMGGAREVVTETSVIARDLMANLRPPALDDFGLVAALRTFAETQSARLNLPVHVRDGDLVTRPGALVEGALFRIAQEAVMNAARHAAPTRIDVSVGERDGRVCLAVEDDGVGFDTAMQAPGPDHWGLKNMRERARSIGGTLKVESTPGVGTRVTADAPRGSS